MLPFVHMELDSVINPQICVLFLSDLWVPGIYARGYYMYGFAEKGLSFSAIRNTFLISLLLPKAFRPRIVEMIDQTPPACVSPRSSSFAAGV